MAPGNRICDLLAERATVPPQEQEPFISMEFYPPKTDQGVTNLMKRILHLQKQEPLFMDMTWGSGGSTSDLTLDLCKQMYAGGVEANMHLTCTNMTHDTIDTAIMGAKEAGIRNILALRGDPPEGTEEWKAKDKEFTCALDLVKHIRELTGDHFCITVSGYPEGHVSKIKKVEEGRELTESEKGRAVEMEDGTYVCSDEDFEQELEYLKKKVDAGANMIITQMIFDAEVFQSFVQQCREIGITVPILPGIMIIQNEHGFTRMTKFCKSRVPQSLRESILKNKDDKAELSKISVDFAVSLCRALEKFGLKGFHFYTLNLEKNLLEVLRQTGHYKATE